MDEGTWGDAEDAMMQDRVGLQKQAINAEKAKQRGKKKSLYSCQSAVQHWWVIVV